MAARFGPASRGLVSVPNGVQVATPAGTRFDVDVGKEYSHRVIVCHAVLVFCGWFLMLFLCVGAFRVNSMR